MYISAAVSTKFGLARNSAVAVIDKEIMEDQKNDQELLNMLQDIRIYYEIEI